MHMLFTTVPYLYFKPARFLFRSAQVNKFIFLKAGEKLIC